jgi:hypothetical protein
MPICPILNGHIGFYYTGTDKVMLICPMFYGLVCFVYISNNIDKTDMSIYNCTYWLDFIGTGIVKTICPIINGYIDFDFISTSWYW